MFEAQDPVPQVPGDQLLGWKFDFEQGDIAFDPSGKPVMVQGQDAYTVWALKAILTERFVYPIYSPEFGTEIAELIRRDLPRSVLDSLLRQEIEDVLRLDPRTLQVHVESVRFRDDRVDVDVRVRLAFGEETRMTVSVPV